MMWFKASRLGLSFKLLGGFLLSSFFLSSFFGSMTPALAQTDQGLTQLSQDLFTRLNGNCQGATEIRYESNQLAHPNGNTTVLIRMNLKRMGQVNSRPVDNFNLIRCTANTSAPLSGELIVVEGEKITRKRIVDVLGLTNSLYNYIVANPVAFSAEGRYLVVRLDLYDGRENTWVNHLVLDTLDDYKLVSFSNCDTYQSNNYLGFLSPSQVVFACENPGTPGPIEVFDLEKRSRRKYALKDLPRFPQTTSYGTIASQFTILDEQQFPR